MLSCGRWREVLALGAEHLEGGGDLAAGVGRVDHRVEQPSLGGAVGVEQALLVVGLGRGPLLRAWPGA